MWSHFLPVAADFVALVHADQSFTTFFFLQPHHPSITSTLYMKWCHVSMKWSKQPGGGRCGFINRFLKQILQADWPYATGPARYDAKWIALNFGTWFKKKKISTSFRGFFHGASSNYIQSNNQHRSTRQPCTFLFKVLALFSISMSSKISIFKFGVHSSLIDSVVLRAASIPGALTRFQAVLVPWAETQTSASVTYFRPWSFGDDLWCWSSFHGFKISSHLLKYRTRTRFPISIFK